MVRFSLGLLRLWSDRFCYKLKPPACGAGGFFHIESCLMKNSIITKVPSVYPVFIPATPAAPSLWINLANVISIEVDDRYCRLLTTATPIVLERSRCAPIFKAFDDLRSDQTSEYSFVFDFRSGIAAVSADYFVSLDQRKFLADSLVEFAKLICDRGLKFPLMVGVPYSDHQLLVCDLQVEAFSDFFNSLKDLSVVVDLP
jgi:hypothetical protein